MAFSSVVMFGHTQTGQIYVSSGKAGISSASCVLERKSVETLLYFLRIRQNNKERFSCACASSEVSIAKSYLVQQTAVLLRDVSYMYIYIYIRSQDLSGGAHTRGMYSSKDLFMILS